MKPHTAFLLCLSLLTAMPARAQSAPAGAERQAPLNLSLPRDFLRSPAGGFGRDAETDLATRNVQAAGTGEVPRGPRYGTGFEARQRGMAEGGEMGGRFGGGARQGSGRGGMGRGR